MASDKQLWLGTPDRLHQLNVQDIGGIMTLSVFQSKYLGDQPKPEDPLATHEQTVIICSARPAGTKDGSKFLLRSDEHLADSDSNNSDTQRFKPSGFPIPKAVNPILAAASCQTRAPRNAKIDEWYKAISSDHILFPRGDEVMQPVVLVFHQDEAPPDDAMEACILGGKGTLTATMQEPLLYPHGETALLAYATDSDLTPESTWLAPMGRYLSLGRRVAQPLRGVHRPRRRGIHVDD
ncbi:hypothetical protein MPSEU_001042200 [Mayamaea pseudoterrestris]|nr:hypothetical protein MPSEU_001042200 [Mayamaea pseudoterrestris]